ncbi:MAG: hypothetical protein QOJ13_948 [Gaiellales bacterium]|nr:hypothetical protein [Gaiellales bacterium]
MRVEASDARIEEILTAGRYVIPRFQRDYSWDLANVEDFWNDIVGESGAADPGGDYFIGAMVVYEEGSALFGVIDGQQRLTTITVLLSVIRDAFDGLGHRDDLASGVQQYISRPDRRNRQQLTLQTEDAYPFLQEGIQRFPPNSGEIPRREDEYLIAAARDKLRELVALDLRDASAGASGVKEEQQRQLDRLESIRDTVLNLQLVRVVVDTVDDAYRIFETLNSRGKDLETHDLIKNQLLRLLPAGSGQADRPLDRWKELMEKVGAYAGDIDADDFFLHSWLSREPYVAKKRLFERFRTQLTSAREAEAELERLGKDADLYAVLANPAAGSWHSSEAPLAGALEALALFRVTQPFPFLLALLRARREGSMRMPAVKVAATAVENFHFLTTAVAARSSSGGVSALYARHARGLFAARDRSAQSEAAQELAADLRSRVPDRDVFQAGFQTIAFSATRPRQRDLVEYILRRLYGDETHAPGPRGWTIEHLASQSASVDPSAVAQVGNLILVPESVNVRLNSKPFPAKQEILRQANGVYVDPAILAADEWGEAEIADRTSNLAEHAYTSVWRIP